MKKIKQTFHQVSNVPIRERLKSFVLRKGRITSNQKESLNRS